jgi:hypothetical protein
VLFPAQSIGRAILSECPRAIPAKVLELAQLFVDATLNPGALGTGESGVQRPLGGSHVVDRDEG